MITVCSVVYNDNDTKLFDITIRSILKYTSPAPNFILCDNGNNDVLQKYSNMDNIKIIKNKPSLSGGSNSHGESLNKIISMVTTDYCAIVESDCMVLYDLNEFLKYNKQLIAIPKTDNLYHVFFIMGNTKKLQKVNFMPKNPLNGKSYKPKNDVGARIGDVFSKDSVMPLTFIDCKKGQGNIYNSLFQSDEVMFEGHTVVAHLGRGSNIGGKSVRKGFKHPRDQLIEWKKKAEEILK